MFNLCVLGVDTPHTAYTVREISFTIAETCEALACADEKCYDSAPPQHTQSYPVVEPKDDDPVGKGVNSADIFTSGEKMKPFDKDCSTGISGYVIQVRLAEKFFIGCKLTFSGSVNVNEPSKSKPVNTNPPPITTPKSPSYTEVGKGYCRTESGNYIDYLDKTLESGNDHLDCGKACTKNQYCIAYSFQPNTDRDKGTCHLWGPDINIHPELFFGFSPKTNNFGDDIELKKRQQWTFSSSKTPPNVVCFKRQKSVNVNKPSKAEE